MAADGIPEKLVNRFHPALFLAAVLISLAVLLSGCEEDSESRRIAHAGGGYEGHDYTNSFEALNENLRKGFRLFEIDLNWTYDEHLVCLHDWSDDATRRFTLEFRRRPTLEEFKALVASGTSYHNCTLDELAVWMEEHPEAILVTDVKSGNLQALEVITKKIKNFEERVIPQIYQPESYRKARGLGFRHIIWTLYRFKGSNREVALQVDEMDGLYAVTMPPGRAKTGLARSLKEKGIYTYTHTINRVSDLEQYRGLGIENVYTDFLPPE